MRFNSVGKTIGSGYEFELKNQGAELIADKLDSISCKRYRSLKNALRFLLEESLIRYKESPDSGGISIRALNLTSKGFRVIEGVESEEYREVFQNHFHIKLAENITLDGLIKNSFSVI
jgi:hypothetical protein